MKNSRPKQIAEGIVLTALRELHSINHQYKDKDILELMLAIAAIGGAFEDGWLDELMPSINAMVAIKRPDIAQEIEARRKRKEAKS